MFSPVAFVSQFCFFFTSVHYFSYKCADFKGVLRAFVLAFRHRFVVYAFYLFTFH